MKKKGKKFFWKFIVVLSVGFFLRVILSNVWYSFDAAAFLFWAKYLGENSLVSLYVNLPSGLTPYPPLYYYILIVVGFLLKLLHLNQPGFLSYFIVKMPVYLADAGIALLIYIFCGRWMNKSEQIKTTAFYYLHPAVIYTSSIWGQNDSLIIFLTLFSIIFFILHHPFLGLLAFVLGALTKLQILALFPIIFFLFFTAPYKKRLLTIGILLFLAGIPFFPLITERGMVWVVRYFSSLPHWYPYTSIYAYNFWAPLGFMVSDKTKFLFNLEIRNFALLLFGVLTCFIIFPLFNKKNRLPITILFATYLLYLNFYLFSTRVHSRYIIYSLGMFAPFIVRYPKIGGLLSFLTLANLLLPLSEFSLLHIYLTDQKSIIFFVGLGLLLFAASMREYLKLVSFPVWSTT